MYTRQQLETKRKELQEEINATEKQLEDIKKNKNATLNELKTLQSSLAQRQRLIGNINDEIGDIDNSIKSSSREVNTLKEKLELSKMRYAQSIRYAYETRSSYGMLAFLFSANDFNDAMRRMKYLRKFREFRKQQADQIRSTETQLQHKIGELNATKAEKDKLLMTEEQQKQELQKKTNQTNQVVQELKGKEAQLRESIEKNRIIANRVNKSIQIYIEAEMAKEAKKAEEEAAKRKLAEAKAPPAKPVKNPPSGGAGGGETKAAPASKKPAPKAELATLYLTPNDITLRDNFEENKGKLPWPVDKGVITDRFGVHPHPMFPKVNIENKGVDIQTDENGVVRAVFDGVVTKIFSADFGKTQIIFLKHGSYFTIYNGLASTSVKVDDHVTARQVIGRVALNDDNLPVVNFQVWKYSGKKSEVPLNPEQWIGKLR